MRAAVELPIGGAAEIGIFLGDAATREEARAAIRSWREADLAVVEADIAAFWGKSLGVLEVKTCARAFSTIDPASPTRSRNMSRSGWAWYTGSGGWLQRAGVEGALGLALRGATLRVDPCIPKRWRQLEATLAYKSAATPSELKTPTASIAA
jgi:cellobiose phosphorylase